VAAQADDAGHPAQVAGSRVLERLTAGDPAAWDEVVATYGETLRRVALAHGLNSSDAEDVVQSTWLRCLERVCTLRDQRALGAWLSTTARRESLHRLRALRRVVPQDHTDRDAPLARERQPVADIAELVARRDEQCRLLHAIVELPERQRAVLLALLHPEDGRYLPAADRLGVPAGSMGPTRRRALDRLRRDPRLADAG